MVVLAVLWVGEQNTTRSRRAKLLERNRKERKAVLMLFVESICDDDEVLRRNYELKLENNGESRVTGAHSRRGLRGSNRMSGLAGTHVIVYACQPNGRVACCPDYKGMDPEVALRDFMERVRAYEAVYEAVEDTEDQGKIAYIKVSTTQRASEGRRTATH